jgi:hypothetical protein
VTANARIASSVSASWARVDAPVIGEGLSMGRSPGTGR